MDDNPESLKLFRNENIAATMNALREIQREAKKDGKKRSQESTSTDDSEDEEGKIDITIDEDTQEDDIIDRHMVRIEQEETTAEACNIEIMIIKGAIEPKDLKPQEVKQLFEEHKLKYKIKGNSLFTQENIEYLIDQNRLRAEKEDVMFIPQAGFRKIRNGPQTSPPKDDSRKTKMHSVP
ncbi:hypothetical protein EQH57_0835 [Dictyocoela roeselum]|nr:hypothetical protein EQH57_0835 [Dictyocoela roeselum]